MKNKVNNRSWANLSNLSLCAFAPLRLPCQLAGAKISANLIARFIRLCAFASLREKICVSLTMLMICITLVSVAQEKDKPKEKWGEGEIEKVEIEIVKDRQIVLPNANRNFEKVPPRPAEPIKPEITYDFKNLNFATADYSPSIRPLRLQQEPIEKLYGNYVSAGFGNFSSPLFEAYLTNKRSKEKFYGLKFFHQSFRQGSFEKNNANGNTELSVFGKAFGQHATTGGFLKFENLSNHFYGIRILPNANQEITRQSYTIVSLGGAVENPKDADFNYKLNAGFSYLKDAFKAAETEVDLSFQSDYNFSEDKKLLINSEYFLIARQDETVDAKPRHIFKVKPAYQFMLIDKLKFTAGINVALQTDALGKSKPFHLYPHVKAEYPLSKSVDVYAALTGDIDKVSLHSLVRENQWLAANVSIFNTNRTMEFLGGLRGRLGSKVAFGGGVSFSNLKDFYFYINKPGDTSRFVTVYDDGNTQRTNLFGEISFSQSKTVRLSLRGDLYSYSTDNIAVAWHRPTYRVVVNSSFNIVDKFLISADILAQGGAKVFKGDAKPVETLGAALDLNVRLNYLVSKQFSVFVKGNNLLGNEYQLFLNYPVRGLQVMGGLTYVF